MSNAVWNHVRNWTGKIDVVMELPVSVSQSGSDKFCSEMRPICSCGSPGLQSHLEINPDKGFWWSPWFPSFQNPKVTLKLMKFVCTAFTGWIDLMYQWCFETHKSKQILYTDVYATVHSELTICFCFFPDFASSYKLSVKFNCC